MIPRRAILVAAAAMIVVAVAWVPRWLLLCGGAWSATALSITLVSIVVVAVVVGVTRMVRARIAFGPLSMDLPPVEADPDAGPPWRVPWPMKRVYIEYTVVMAGVLMLALTSFWAGA